MIKVIVGGALGKVGREMVQALSREAEFRLVGAIGRTGAGGDVGDLLGTGRLGITLQPDLSAALAGASGVADVLVDFSTPGAVQANVPAAIARGIAPVVGTTGMDAGVADGWAEACRVRGVGGAICANFAIGAMLMMKFAAEARRYMPDAEIIEMHHQTKRDKPSGTAERTRERLQTAAGDLPGPDIPIHSLRLPGLMAHQAVVFGARGQTLTIRHDAISRDCYVPGVILACRWVLRTRRVARDLEDLTT